MVPVGEREVVEVVVRRDGMLVRVGLNKEEQVMLLILILSLLIDCDLHCLAV